MKQRRVGISCILGIMLLIGVVIYCWNSVEADEKPVITIQSIPVYKEEYEFLASCTSPYRDLVTVKSFQKKQLSESQMDQLKNVIAWKEEQILLQKQNIVKDISYDSFQKKLKEENAIRVKKNRNHEVVYGPVQFEAKVYYDYLYSGYRESAKKKLSNYEELLHKRISKAEIRK